MDKNRSGTGRIGRAGASKHERWCRVLLGALLAIHAGLLAWSGYRHSPGMDEPGHLVAGLSHWYYGRFRLYAVNPPLVRVVATAPLLLAQPKTSFENYSLYSNERLEWPIGRQFLKLNGQRSFWYFTLARWACIPVSLIGGYFCFRWARDLYGNASGIVAATLWCFSPNVLGNGAMITPDTGAAAMGVMAGYFFWRWLGAPSWPRALAAGLTLAAAELTKTTWTVLYAVLPLLWAASRLSQQRDCRARRMEARQLCVLLALSVYFLNLGYGFEGCLKRLGDYEFVSRALAGEITDPLSGNRFADTWLGPLPVPLPENYVRGMDLQKRDFEKGKWSYLRGEQRFGGWWYYYLYAMAVKMPLGTWLLVALAGCFAWKYSAGWRNELTVLAPAAAVLVLVSSQTGFNRYVRYVLPAFPFVFIWASKVARCFGSGAKPLAPIVALGLLWSTLSSLLVYPHSLSYFNTLAGGPSDGHAHLLDANIDWGQDLLYLRRWLDAHRHARPLHLEYFGAVDPQIAGIESQSVPRAQTVTTTPDQAAMTGPQPGWYAISVNSLRGYKHDGTEEPAYSYFQNFQPVARAGYSIYIYRLRLPEVNLVRRQLGLPAARRRMPHVPARARRR